MEGSYVSQWRKMTKSVMKRSSLQQNDENQNRYFVEKYYQAIKRNEWAVGRWILKHLDIRSSDRVLDVGSGPGTVALPLAKRGNEVIALDRSTLMLDRIERSARKYSLPNLYTLNCALEDLDMSVYARSFESVISSFSIMTVDIVDALLRLHRLSSRKVHIVWHDDMGALEQVIASVWERITGIEYVPAPSALILYNILFEMGIFPNVYHSHVGYAFSYDSHDEAIRSILSMNGVPIDDEKDFLIAKKEMVPFVEIEDGKFIIRYNTPVSFISWDVKKQSPVKS